MTGETEFAAMERWLTVLGIRTLAEWDTLVFLVRHRFSLIHNEQIPKLAGYDTDTIFTALSSLQDLGLVKRIRYSGVHSVYWPIVPQEQSRKPAYENLMTLADNRSVRLALMKRLAKVPALSEGRARPKLLIVAFGGSAGALAPLREIFSHLPVDTGMAFVVVQHLAPQSESLLPEILAKVTTLPVLRIGDGMRIRPNHIFVIPPNTNLTIIKGKLRLGPRSVDEQGRHRSIDTFFIALAKERTARAISVILSGMDSDGVIGTAAIKSGGGITLAQRPDTASEPALPQNVIADGWVDFVQTPREIAELLLQLSQARAQWSFAADIWRHS